MTSISGGYERHDRSVGITSQSVAVTQKGRTYEHGNLNEYMNKSVSGTTWSFSIPSDWYSVMTDAVTGWVGANYTFSMHRGSSDWSHTVYCPVVTNVITPPID